MTSAISTLKDEVVFLKKEIELLESGKSKPHHIQKTLARLRRELEEHEQVIQMCKDKIK